ncbi:hypothetical protein E2562_014986 [Oryza meyeriana var. granulata]|uniref:HMA domain-containing protein n=1 Tax=Oryza meyeriana var. granulata TaxID=110450 RepID=A0A6G1EJA5_9ORYZ|nr:hypothetical protein E2562_014986 [Oryza meyeriana var. granulata]
MAILVISANLKCCRCKEKLSKILCSLREKYCIEKTEFEDKDEIVIVRGNFPPDKLRRVIWCKAGGKLIRDIAIVEVWPPPKKKPADPPAAPAAGTTKTKADKGRKAGKATDEKGTGKGPTDEKKKPPPPPKPECKLVPFPWPYPLPYYYPMQCQSSTWTGSCPLQCHCCPKPPPPETNKKKTCECSRDHCHGGCKTITPPPSGCGGCTGHGDCGGWCGRRPINCPPPPCPQQPDWPPPWGGCKVVCQQDESACSVM